MPLPRAPIRAATLALALGVAGAAAQQPAPPQAPAAPAAAPVAVEPEAPKGGSGAIAMGAGVGLVAGLIFLTFIVGTASVD